MRTAAKTVQWSTDFEKANRITLGNSLERSIVLFFEFKAEDIAFVILPRRYENMFRKAYRSRNLEIKIYEDLVGENLK